MEPAVYLTYIQLLVLFKY